ncbi:predicted protein [Naegleria gruberi]|uniref:Predicted protein n=1 Tax=Naegleria gruberi TaxID=5762 RepID=D2W1G5_NAEGR|nr:uncharacterized protein NAEGRDRAFT_75209 [Naegleria gruberi]EFC37042.1 predicted protein [Naegleria gruberi]|eukprot:XP_002669786.1 predicted protein [Naegleria gruberi strain NEG-M]
MESFALNTQLNGYNNDNNYVVLQESDLSTFDSMLFNTTTPPQQISEDHFLTPSPLQSQQHLFTPNSATPEGQQIFNQYMFTFLHQLQSQQQNNTCVNYHMPVFDACQRSQQELFDPATFNLNGDTMLRLDSEEIFLNEEDVTVNQNIQHNFDFNENHLNLDSKPIMPHQLQNNQHSFLSPPFNHHFINESNAIGTPSDLKEEEFFSGFIPEMYHADVDVIPKNETCGSPLSSSSASNSAANSINNSSTNNVNNTSNNNSNNLGPIIQVPGLTSNFSPKEATLSSWFNSISKLPESSIVLKCDPYGFTENNGTCRPRGSQYSVFVNDNIRIDFSFKIPSNLDLYFEQDGVNKSIFDLFIEECKFELCSFLDDDDTNTEVVIESSESISNIKKTDDLIQISLTTVIKRDTNNKRASRSKAKPTTEEKKGRKKKKNESCASKKVCFLRIVTPDSSFVLVRSDNLWVRSKTRQEMERKKDRAMAQKRKKEESKPVEDYQEEKESPKKKKKTSSKSKSKKSKSKSQTVNSFSYEQSPLKGGANSATYGVVFNLDSM